MRFLGLDLTSSESKPTAAVAIEDKLKVIFCGYLGDDDAVINTVNSQSPDIVAIDAPLALPLGLHCLEESCPCPPPSALRSAELELRKLGIGLFITNKKTIIKKMVKRGIKLKSQLSQLGYTVLEVYPYATKRVLWGQKIPKKSTPEGLTYLKETLAELLPNIGPFLSGLTHDKADAALAAYTAYLYHQGKAKLIGSEADGQICIPR